MATIPLADTLNQNADTGGHWGPKHPKVKDLRERGGWLFREHHKGMAPRFERCHVTATLAFPDRILRDTMNWYPTAKAMVDGFADARMVSNDNAKHVIGPHLWPADELSGTKGMLHIRFTITPLPPAPVF